MTHPPRITIITPTLNQGKYLEQTIHSVLNQHYSNLEYIIVDGGSSDQTPGLLKKYSKQLSWWTSEPDRGQADAICKGLSRATGELFNWINGDDYLEPDALNYLAGAYRKNPGGNVFCGYTRCFWEKTGKTSHTYRMGKRRSVAQTILDVKMNQPGTFYRRDIVNDLGGINTTLNYVFDNELWMRYLCRFGQKNVIMLKETLAHFRQHPESKSFGDGFRKFYDEKLMINQYLLDELDDSRIIADAHRKRLPQYYYVSTPWDLSQLEKDKLLAYFKNRMKTSLYNKGEQKTACEYLYSSIKHGFFKLSRKDLALLWRCLCSNYQ